MKNKTNYFTELTQARQKWRLSPKKVAKIIGKDASTVMKYEKGYIHPSLETAIKLESLYRTPVSHLYPELSRAIREELRIRERMFEPKKRRAVEASEKGATR